MPLFRSAETLAACLRALAAQTERDVEVILVDSSPDAASAAVLDALDLGDLAVRYQRSERRMLPQEARNAGVELARGELLVFTDPDAYAAPDWLERLLAAHRETGAPIAGAIACYGADRRDRALHLLKFSRWLPIGERRPIDMGPTVNLLCPRALFLAAGGFQGDMMMGDATFGWQLRRLGRGVVFEPRAVVEHDHLGIVWHLVAERFARGARFGLLRARWEGWSAARALLYAASSVLPIRLVSNLAHVLRHAGRSGELETFLRSLPLLALGFAASLAGEASGYRRAAFDHGRPPRRTTAAAPAEVPVPSETL